MLTFAGCPCRIVQKQINYERKDVVKNPLDPAELNAAMDKVHRAGIPGVFAEVRDGDQVWRGAAGVADVSTGRPVTPDMRHRVGSISKSFTAAAVLQQVESGQNRAGQANRPLLAGICAWRTWQHHHCSNADQPHQRPSGISHVCVPVAPSVPSAGGHHAQEPGRPPFRHEEIYRSKKS
jgi:hypothetical protein